MARVDGERTVEKTVVWGPEENPLRKITRYFGRLVENFGWKYVAMAMLIYGVQQGLGESFLFNSEMYYFFDVQNVTVERYTRIDGFADIPWQIKALYGMLSDTVALCGYKRTPYILIASFLGVVSGVALAATKVSATVAALFLVAANLSLAMPDVIIDATAAEKAQTHPHLASDVQALLWGSLNFFAFFGEIATGYLEEPEILGSKGVFGLFAATGAIIFVPASLGWLGEKKRTSYAQLGEDRGDSPKKNPIHEISGAFLEDDDDDDDDEAQQKKLPPLIIVKEEEETRDARDARGPVFVAAGATTAVSLTIGMMQLLYDGKNKEMVEGCVTVGLGLGLAVFLYFLLRRVSPELAGSAVYIFLEGACQPSTGVIFQWSHDDGEDCGNCAGHCDETENDDLLRHGWARDRDYPCISPTTYGYAKAVARIFGLVGVVWYNAYFSHWPYRRIFTLGTIVYFLANLLDLVWVSRTNLRLGLNDDVFLFGAEIIQPVLRRLHIMPIFVLAAKLCPANVEATLFALLMGLSNFGSTVGMYNGAALLAIFGGVDKPEYHHITSFVFVRTLLYLTPLVLIPIFVPTGGPQDDPHSPRHHHDDEHHRRQSTTPPEIELVIPSSRAAFSANAGEKQPSSPDDAVVSSVPETPSNGRDDEFKDQLSHV